MATTTYLLTTPDMEEEIAAASLDHARQVAARRIREEYAPRAWSTYWVHAQLWDDDEIVADWPEAVDPDAPDCDPPTPDLGEASVDDLERAWGVNAWPDGEHVWAATHLLGGYRKTPGMFGFHGGLLREEMCLRCGTLRVTDTWATDRETGKEGLFSIEYHPARYAKQVAAQGDSR